MSWLPDAAAPAIITGQWPLMGREQLIADGLQAVRAGSGIVVAAGDAGMGKSRVAAAIADALRDEGWYVLAATATSIMSAVPLGALSALLTGDRSILDQAGSDGGALLRLALETLRQRASTPRRLLVLDDLSLLDPVSTTLVAQLVASDALQLVATLRAGDPLPAPIQSMWNADHSLRLHIGPLAIEDCDRLLRAVLGGPVAHRTSRELRRAADGNPLYLRELVRGGLDAGRLVWQGGTWQLVGPPSATPALRDLILSRLSHLEADERDVVERLALCGDLPLSQLARPGARAATGRLESAGLVVVSDDMRVRLSHAQYTAAIVGTLSRVRAADLLLEQVGLLERNGITVGTALRAATWRMEAGADADPQTLLSAARIARQSGDHPSTRRLAKAAAAVGSGELRAEALLLQGEAELRQGRVIDSLATLEAAAALTEHGSIRAYAVAATTAMAHASVNGGLDAGLDVLRAAEVDADTPDPGLALVRSLLVLYTNDPLEADRIVCETAATLGDSPAERAIIASAHAQTLAALGHAVDAEAAARTALEFAEMTHGRAISGHTVPNALTTLATVLLHQGDVNAARATAMKALITAIDDDDEIVARSIEFLLARIAVDAGQVETARRWYGDTVSGALVIGPISLYVPGLAGLALAKAQHGDPDSARADLAMISAQADGGPGATAARAWIDALAGDVPSARRALLTAAEQYDTRGHRFLAAYMLHTLTRLGCAADAAPRLAVIAAASGNPLFARQARHAAAEAAADIEELVEVGADWEQAGADLAAAEAFASASRAARRGRDHRTAVSLHARAEATAARCEGAMTPLLQFTQELSPLTRREREIAGLAAGGLSSKDIAARLFLSTRTVDNHLQSVYGKLGVAGRRELTQRASAIL